MPFKQIRIKSLLQVEGKTLGDFRRTANTRKFIIACLNYIAENSIARP